MERLEELAPPYLLAPGWPCCPRPPLRSGAHPLLSRLELTSDPGGGGRRGVGCGRAGSWLQTRGWGPG